MSSKENFHEYLRASTNVKTKKIYNDNKITIHDDNDHKFITIMIILSNILPI